MTVNRRWLRILSGYLAALLVIACAGDNPGKPKPVAPSSARVASSAAVQHVVTFEVTGPASADISYSIGGDQAQENGVKLPWRKDITVAKLPFIMSILAQNKTTTGTITCKITADGAVRKENKSSGEYAVVTCTG
jgi:hypothetical protein